MQYVLTSSNSQKLDQNNITVTGHTITYGNKVMLYIPRTMFERIFKINRRTLIRYRRNIIKAKPEVEHKYYFIQKDGSFWYSVNILEFRKYKRGAKHVKILPQNLLIDHCDKPLETVNSPIFSGLLSIPWDYACGAKYVKKKELYQCVDKMKVLYSKLENEFSGSAITFYYTTEFKEGSYHSHFLLSISGEKEKGVIRRLKNHVRSLGTQVPFVEPYDNTDDYLEYITKEVHLNPDGWGILTNSERDAELLAA